MCKATSLITINPDKRKPTRTHWCYQHTWNTTLPLLPMLLKALRPGMYEACFDVNKLTSLWNQFARQVQVIRHASPMLCAPQGPFSQFGAVGYRHSQRPVKNANSEPSPRLLMVLGLRGRKWKLDSVLVWTGGGGECTALALRTKLAWDADW